MKSSAITANGQEAASPDLTKLSVLGATGSIGLNTLEIVRQFPHKFKIHVFSGNTTAGLVEENGASVVNAEYNYWNSANGPTHIDNPDGTGDAVMGQVNYVPFISMTAPELVVVPGLFGNSLSWTHPNDATIAEYIIERCCDLPDITVTIIGDPIPGTHNLIDEITHRNESSMYSIRAIDHDDNESLISSTLVVQNHLLDTDHLDYVFLHVSHVCLPHYHYAAVYVFGSGVVNHDDIGKPIFLAYTGAHKGKGTLTPPTAAGAVVKLGYLVSVSNNTGTTNQYIMAMSINAIANITA